MEYNTTREKLILPEYGRNVQNMVEHAMTIEDRDERQACAESIIKIMAKVFPQQKDPEELERMLWDHLALISGYKLDVVSPYPTTILVGEEQEHPHLDYPKSTVRFRHYGRLLEEMIVSLADMPEGEDRDAATELVVAQMAKSLSAWNRNILTPEKIADDIDYFTEGRLQLSIPLQRMNAIIHAAASQTKPQGGKKKKK